MWKREAREQRPPANGIVTTLLCCQIFRPCMRRAFVLALLSVAGLFASVTYSKGLVAWSSIFVANPMAPRALLGQESLRLVPEPKNFSDSLKLSKDAALATSSVTNTSRTGSRLQSTATTQHNITGLTLHDFGRINDVVAVTEYRTTPVQEVIPKDIVIKPRDDVEEGTEKAGDSKETGGDTANTEGPAKPSGEPSPNLGSGGTIANEVGADATTQLDITSNPASLPSADGDPANTAASQVDTHDAGNLDITRAESHAAETSSVTAATGATPGDGVDMMTLESGEPVASVSTELPISPAGETASIMHEDQASTSNSANMSESPSAEGHLTMLEGETTASASAESSETPAGGAGNETTKSASAESSMSPADSSDLAKTEGGPVTMESASAVPSESSTSPDGGKTEMSTESGMMMNYTAREEGTTSEPALPLTRPRKHVNNTHYVCNSTFCQIEAKYLSGILKSGRDPCDNFYKFACTGWDYISSDSQHYSTVDDALTASMEDMVMALLQDKGPTQEMPVFHLWEACTSNASENEEMLNQTLASLGLTLAKKDSATIEDVLKAAGNLIFKLNSAPLLSIELVMVPADEKEKMIAIGEADTILSKKDAMMPTGVQSLQESACKFLKDVGIVMDEKSQLCKNVGHFGSNLALASFEMKNLYYRMEKYTIVNYTNVSMFGPLFDMIEGIKNYTTKVPTVHVKNPEQLEVVKSHFNVPTVLYSYLALHTTIYLSPFFQNKDYLWDSAIYLLTGRNRPHPVPMWRLCLRLADRVLPGFMIVVFQKNETGSPQFLELMADVMAEEVHTAFIDEVMALQHFDSWTKYILTKKAQNMVVHSLFPARLSAGVLAMKITQMVGTVVHWKTSPLEFFMAVSAIVAADWTSSLRHPLVDRRKGLSVFDTDCHFNPQKNAIVLPLGFFNMTVPTSAKERMFHIPRIGPRISQCLFRATFGANFFQPHDFFWTKQSSSKVETLANCFNSQYSKQNMAYQDRLWSKQYFEMDYVLDGLPDATADQLFFLYYALNHCQKDDVGSANTTMSPEEMVNIPLMNSPDFSTAFKCNAGTPMNPAKKCAFWS